MEIQELRARIRQWKAREQGGEYVEDEAMEPPGDTRKLSTSSRVDVESSEVEGYEEYQGRSRRRNLSILDPVFR